MPDLRDCLNAAVRDGQLDPRRASQAAEAYAELYDGYRRTMPDAAAAAAAKRDLRDAAKRTLAEGRHATLAQLQRMRANALYVERAADPAGAIKSALVYREGGGHDVIGVDAVQKSLRRQLLAGMRPMLAAFSRNVLGVTRNRALLGDVVKELHGEASGNAAARQLADAWRATAAQARQLFNAHGGHIGELADWGLPHSHDAKRIRGVGFDAWRREVEPLLAWHRIEDRETGKPFAAAAGGTPDPRRAAAFLRDVYDGIVTEGWNTRRPSGQAAGRALWNRRADHRVLHFAGGEAWLAYNNRFGQSDPWAAMIRHIDGMARDVALMRVLGPNPAAGLEHMIQTARRKAIVAGDDETADAVKKAGKQAKAILAHLTGAANTPEHAGFARFFGGVRSVLTSAQLGSAILSSPTDLWTVRMAARAVGMGGGAPLKRAVQLMASSATQETAARMGYVFDTLADVGSSHARYLMEGFAPEITERLASGVMRVSGLAYWTDVHRTAFQMEFSGHLAEAAGRRIADIDPPLRDLLTSRGITDEDWAILGDPTLLFEPTPGATFLAPTSFRENALAAGLDPGVVEGLATRLGGIIEEQLEFAVPTNSIEMRAKLLGVNEPGTIFGELLRSTMMYKSFMFSLTMNQLRRTLAQATPAGRAAYAAQMIAGLTVLGAVGVQIKEVAKGRDPRDMTDPIFWGAAVFQGGGLGIFGDFFASESSRAGGGWQETVAGPVVGFGGDVARLFSSNATRAGEGKPVLAGRDAIQLARRYTPGGTLWYARTALDRMVWDQMQMLIDPEAEREMRRMMRRQTNATGNAYWWQEGRAAPSRAPDLAAAAGGNAR